MAKIFIIGATGHIGGAVLDQITTTYPTASVTLLVRDEEKAARVVAKYPQVIPKIGDLNSIELLQSSSKNSDVVITAILRGLQSGGEKKYYIHTSGAALIWDQPDGSKAGDKIWDDVEDIGPITSMPDEKTHRLTDKMVFTAASTVNVAIISPVAVYGRSPATEHPLPLTLPEVVTAIKSINSGFTISKGANISGYIHVVDLARIYLLLLSSALSPQSSQSSAVSLHEIWGPQAYYFGTGDEELSFVDYMTLIVGHLHELGALETKTLQQIDVNDAAKASGASTGIPPPDSWAMHIAIMFGVNMRVRSTRARRLGWQPVEPKVEETLEDVIHAYLSN
ncbi:NAD(P)-binding protein [Stipitochalara longipes BDJ]|nr:NAD(P)-binding protein [Stipitochalara longipes BDJ]